jgi:zinc transport system ATP-binding protein
MPKYAAITFENVTVKYDSIIALDDINFTIEEGDYVGIIGPNGGGKTTILKTILGLIQPTSGNISIFGQSPHKARQIIGYVPQIAQFERFYPIDVMDVVLMGRLNKRAMFRPYSKLDKEIASESLGFVGMADFRKRQLGKLSGGQIQRVMVARALASQPKILLLDEPTASVDYQAEQNLYELLAGLSNNMTIILVSHDIGVVSRQVKSLACLNRKLFHHGSKEILPSVMETVYGCPVDLIAHGTPHRVLPDHDNEGHNHA